MMDDAGITAGLPFTSGPMPPVADPAPQAVPDERLLPSKEIERILGQSVAKALDLTDWVNHGGLQGMLTHIGGFVNSTVEADRQLRAAVREQALSKLEWLTDAPADAGVYRIDPAELRAALRNHLLPGAVTAVHAACTGHDAHTASLIAIGVSLVRYLGEQRTWQTTFLRHDFDVTPGNTLEEVRRYLDLQGRRGLSEDGVLRDQLSLLLRRGFMAAAERKSLLEKASSPWRVGRGVPAPLELLTGAGSVDLLDHVLPILERLLLENHRWLFLPNHECNAALLTLANALQEGELGIFVKGKATLQDILARGHFPPGYGPRVQKFATELGEQMVIGGFRATRDAPARLFAAHTKHGLLAGTLAMADAQLQPHRGTPLLLDLAGETARIGLGIEAFHGTIESLQARETERRRNRQPR